MTDPQGTKKQPTTQQKIIFLIGMGILAIIIIMFVFYFIETYGEKWYIATDENSTDLHIFVGSIAGIIFVLSAVGLKLDILRDRDFEPSKSFGRVG